MSRRPFKLKYLFFLIAIILLIFLFFLDKERVDLSNEYMSGFLQSETGLYVSENSCFGGSTDQDVIWEKVLKEKQYMVGASFEVFSTGLSSMGSESVILTEHGFYVSLGGRRFQRVSVFLKGFFKPCVSNVIVHKF